MSDPAYAELCVTSNFSFLRGASHPEELVTRAAELGLHAIAITDRNSVAGVVRAYAALKELARLRAEGWRKPRACAPSAMTDPSSRQTTAPQAAPMALSDRPLPRLIPGARLVLTDSATEWLALPTDLPAWSRLTRLLTLGKRRAPKGDCHLTRADLYAGCHGMILIACRPTRCKRRCPTTCATCLATSPASATLAPRRAMTGATRRGWRILPHGRRPPACPWSRLAMCMMHAAARRPLADVLTCLRLGLTIDTIGQHRLPHAEHRLKPAQAMARMFRHPPAAIRRTVQIADACAFGLDELRYQYPDEAQNGEPAQARLERLAGEGLRKRYPAGAPPKIVERTTRELRLIADLDYAPYFLTVHDIVAFARSRGILCQGRGSAANSVVCYLLGVTEVPPDSITLIFERFISKERGEPPDIDVDFEHERREEVIQHIYDRYGRDRAGLTATVIHFRTRAAIREVGKVMGLSADVIGRLSGQLWGWSAAPPDADRLRAAGLDPDDRRMGQALALIAEIIGFPRHLSQHVGGFVITKGRLDDLCPIENAAMEDRTIIEWDKDDIDTLGLLKVDVLALGMLTAIRKSFDLLAQHGASG